MPLSDQEMRCIELACGHLSSTVGGIWAVESYPDELYPAEPTPEVIVTNGSVRAAIEVKRLTGDSIDQAYVESLISLERFLAPSCGGYYALTAPYLLPDFRLPWDKKFKQHIKREIERLGPGLVPGDSGAVRVPRRGLISLSSTSGPPRVSCYHGGPFSQLLRPLLKRVPGQFMLDDKGPGHSFVTDEGRNAFYDAVVDAYQRRLKGDATQFIWYEEWSLKRLPKGKEVGDDKDGVWVLAFTELRPIADSVKECVDHVLDNALRKFATKRWANLHVLVLEEASVSVPARFVPKVLADRESDDLRDVDIILVVEDEKIIPIDVLRQLPTVPGPES